MQRIIGIIRLVTSITELDSLELIFVIIERGDSLPIRKMPGTLKGILE